MRPCTGRAACRIPGTVSLLSRFAIAPIEQFRKLDGERVSLSRFAIAPRSKFQRPRNLGSLHPSRMPDITGAETLRSFAVSRRASSHRGRHAPLHVRRANLEEERE